MHYKITKRFGRKISKDYNSYDFSTELSTDVDVDSAEELEKESKKVFSQARELTYQDIDNTFAEENKNASNG